MRNKRRQFQFLTDVLFFVFIFVYIIKNFQNIHMLLHAAISLNTYNTYSHRMIAMKNQFNISSSKSTTHIQCPLHIYKFYVQNQNAPFTRNMYITTNHTKSFVQFQDIRLMTWHQRRNTQCSYIVTFQIGVLTNTQRSGQNKGNNS